MSPRRLPEPRPRAWGTACFRISPFQISNPCHNGSVVLGCPPDFRPTSASRGRSDLATNPPEKRERAKVTLLFFRASAQDVGARRFRLSFRFVSRWNHGGLAFFRLV